jgi:hypothetical protein
MLLFVAAEDTRKEAAGRVLGACGGAWFVVPGICVYVDWLGGGAIMPGTRTRPVAARGRRRAGAPSLAVKVLLQMGFQLLKVPFSRFIIHHNYYTQPAPTAARARASD